MINKTFPCLLTIVIVLLSFEVQGQIDSLTKALNNSLEDTTRLALMNKIAFDYRTRDTDSTLSYARKAYKLAKSINDNKWVSRSMYSLGVGYHIKGTFDSAIFFYQKAIPIAQGVDDPKGLSRLYNNLGLIDWNKGDLTSALKYFLQSYEIDEKLDDVLGMARSINNIGLIYQSLEEYEASLTYFRRAEKILKRIGNDFRLSQLHNNFGLVYQRLKKADSALIHYRKSLSYARSADANCYSAHPMAGIADLLSSMEEASNDSLVYYARNSVEISRKCGLPKIQSAGLIALGDAFAKLGDMGKAKSSYEEALSLAKAYQIQSSIKDSYKRFYEFYKKLNDNDKALLYFEKYEEIKSTMIDEENVREIAVLEAKYQSDKEKQKLLAQQEKERILYEQQFQQEKATRNFYFILALASLVIIILLLIIYRRERKAIRALKKKNKLIQELSDFKIELINMIAHDIKNPLNSIIRLSDQIERKVGGDISKAGQAILRLITNMLDVEKYEEATPNLTLEDTQLSKVLAEVNLSVELLLHDKSIKLHIDLEKEVVVKVDMDLITRVFINLVSNAIKYSPSNDIIRITSHSLSIKGKEYVKIGVSDNGSGIPEQEQQFIFEKFYQREVKKLGITPSTGLGLSFCKMAVSAHDGTISVESKENVGSTFWVTLEASNTPKVGTGTDSEYLDLVLSKEDRQILESYSHRLKELKIHKVSAIMAILDEIEQLDLQTLWPRQVRSAVQYSNEARFEELLKMVL